MDRKRIGIVLMGVMLALACTSSAAYGAAKCSPQSYRQAQATMTSRLLATGYSKPQAIFLMRNADRMTSALRADQLNDKARACGIDSARAYVLACLDKQLFPLSAGPGSPLDETKQTKGFWGRKRLTERELLFVSDFHACLGAAKEFLFRG
ncbi:hypothetical protein LB572_00845 [Mesorhizobium sp. BH1-1-5]|uniref:hypothetical protein n=1 Tax=unclassified Mesorhizobium TaxID=325217 RepID=UPI00112B4E0F|nr:MULTISPECIES: hypothetical protein [unclassified Mesorhizobium]MBZ9985635.1 hypothetical protein [Mesorhizobium sp. BH1-1-5]TPJ70813.1 hypothetical protein FJ471_08865 [Mesorhizobium sp. B2-7-1]